MTTIAEARNKAGASPIYLVEIILLNGGPTLYFSDRSVTIGSQDYFDFIQSIDGISEEVKFLTSESLNADITITFKNESYQSYSYLSVIGDTYPFDGATCTIKEVYQISSGVYSDVETLFVGVLDEPTNITLVSFSCTVSDKVISADEKYSQPIFIRDNYPKLPAYSVGKLINDIGFGTVEKVEGTGVDVGAVSLLSSTMATSDLSFTVDDGSLFPTSNFTVQIDTELIYVTLRSSNTFSGLTRGYNNTRAEDHGLKTVYEVKTEYVYHLFDSPVQSIDKVFIDGKEQVSGYTAYTGQSGNELTGYSGKAMIVFDTEAYVGKQRNLSYDEAETKDTVFERTVLPDKQMNPLAIPYGAFTTRGGILGGDYTFCGFPDISYGEIVTQQIDITVVSKSPYSTTNAPNDYSTGPIMAFVNVIDSITGNLTAQQSLNTFEGVASYSYSISFTIKGGNWTDYVTLTSYGPHFSANKNHPNFYLKSAIKKVKYRKTVKTQIPILNNYNNSVFFSNMSNFESFYKYGRSEKFQYPSFYSLQEQNLKVLKLETDKIYTETPTTKFLAYGYPDIAWQDHIIIGQYSYGTQINYTDDTWRSLSGSTVRQEYVNPQISGTIFKQKHSIGFKGTDAGLKIHIIAINKETQKVVGYKEKILDDKAKDEGEIVLEYFGGDWEDYTVVSVSLDCYREYWGSPSTELATISISGIFKEVEYIPDTTESSDDTNFNSSGERVIGQVISATASFTQDDSSGTYSGTANSLLTRPDHIIKYLLKDKLSFTDGEIDSASFATAGTNYATNNIRHDYVINFSIDRFSEILKSLASQARSVLYFKQGKWYLNYVPDSAPAAAKTISYQDTAKAMFLFSKTPRADIKNDIQTYYKKFYYKPTNADSDYESYYQNTDSTSISKFGNRTEELYLWAVRDSTTAQNITNFNLLYKKNPKTLVVFPVYFENFDLHEYDTFDITNSINNAMKFVIEKIDRSGKGIVQIAARSWE